MLSALWKYRGFIFASVRREFDARYRVAALGGLWAVLQPAAQIAVYTLVLSGVMRARLPGHDSGIAYGVYLCAGILTWSLFAETITRCTGVFVENANLLKKLSFPRICLPAIAVLSATVNFVIVLAIFLVVLALTGALPGLPLLAVVPLVVLHVALAASIGMLLGVANVFYRDVSQGIAIVLQFWFWLTPIVYPLAILPESFRPLILANPLTPLAQSYQRIFVDGAWPQWYSLVAPLVVAAVLLPMAFAFFRAHSGEMVDEL
jgi:lipopolysaccharide transport system permease protein